jgi:MarR family transcriptional regulator, organic hydroperoxide resistance regulator
MIDLSSTKIMHNQAGDRGLTPKVKQAGPDKLLLGEDYLLWILLNQTRVAVFKAREKQTGKYQYPNQAAALIIIWSRSGKATPTLLSRYLFLERHTASELITRMEENGLVTKKRDAILKSVVRISITDKGKEICTHHMDSVFIGEMMSLLTIRQRAQLKSILSVLLNKACEKMGVKVILPSNDD